MSIVDELVSINMTEQEQSCQYSFVTLVFGVSMQVSKSIG